MKKQTALSAFALALSFASPAFAHTGHGVDGLAAGLSHPVFGADHLLAMVAVGMWAGLVGGRSLWLWPASFVGAMLLGGVLGMAGIALPAIELAIVGSVVALGLAVAFAFRPQLAVGAVAIAAFGLAHGNAHGLEAPVDGSGLAYAVGFVIATAALHGIGLLLARLMRGEKGAKFARGIGALLALAGIGLIAG